MASEAGKDLLQVAAVQKSYGAEGSVVLSFKNFYPEDIDSEEPVFIYHDGLPVPYFFESFSGGGNSRAIAKFQGVRSLGDAEELVGRGVFVRKSDYEFTRGEDDPSAFVGWTVLNADGRPAGTVSGFEDIPGNLCIYIKVASGEEKLVPLREELFISADENSRTLVIDIPDGLLDL